ALHINKLPEIDFLLLFSFFVTGFYVYHRLCQQTHKTHFGTLFFTDERETFVEGGGFYQETFYVPGLVGGSVVYHRQRLGSQEFGERGYLIRLVAVGELKIGELITAVFVN